MRGLLQQPKEPAIIRIRSVNSLLSPRQNRGADLPGLYSFFATIFHEQGRGTLSTLITSQFFDIPVISCVPAGRSSVTFRR